MCLYLSMYHCLHGLLFFICPQHHVTFDPAGSYAVHGLKPDTLYLFSLAARSEMGLGLFTQPIEARTAQSSKYYCPLMSLSHMLFRLFVQGERKVIHCCILVPVCFVLKVTYYKQICSKHEVM